jgi:hypothetical protein
MFQGKTKPAGTIITYSVGPGGFANSATIEILDLEGRVIRAMDGPAEEGLNRVVWDLREDNPFQDLSGGGRFRPTGLEVLPGTYGIRVRAGGAEESGSVEVLADPRVEIALQARIARREAVQAGTAIMATLQEIQSRLQDAAEGIEGLKERLGNRRDEQARAILALADSVLAEGLGVGDEVSDLSRSSRQLYSLASVRDAPTESDRIALAKSGETVDRLISRVNAYLVGRVGALRDATDAAGLGALPELRPVIRRDSPGGSGRPPQSVMDGAG